MVINFVDEVTIKLSTVIIIKMGRGALTFGNMSRYNHFKSSPDYTLKKEATCTSV